MNLFLDFVSMPQPKVKVKQVIAIASCSDPHYMGQLNLISLAKLISNLYRKLGKSSDQYLEEGLD